MDTGSGRLYSAEQVERMTPERRAELVEIIGTPSQVQAVSRAVKAQHRADPVRKAKRQQQRQSRRRNR